MPNRLPRITHTYYGDEHRVTIESDRMDCDYLVYIFTSEGVIVDAVTGGIVTGTDGGLYEEIEAGLGAI